jgi:hypothetical protein
LPFFFIGIASSWNYFLSLEVAEAHLLRCRSGAEDFIEDDIAAFKNSCQ